MPPALDRTAVADLTWDELKDLDAGSWFDAAFSDERLRQTTERLKAREVTAAGDLASVIEALSAASSGNYLSWLRAGRDNATQLIPVDGVVYFKADHKYKLILETNNPSTGFRDMMAVLFLYLYDKEMDENLKKLGLVDL